MITSIGDMFPAITHNLQQPERKIHIFKEQATPAYNILAYSDTDKKVLNLKHQRQKF